MTKISHKETRDLFIRYQNGETQTALAEELGMTQAALSQRFKTLRYRVKVIFIEDEDDRTNSTPFSKHI